MDRYSRFRHPLLIILISLIGLSCYGQESTNTAVIHIKYGNIDKLQKLITPQLINACVVVEDSKQYNYLALSIKLKSMKSLQFFIENGADIEHVCADKTPLMFAAKYGQLEMVKYLVEKGADINASYKGNKAIDYSRKYNHYNITRYLRKQIKALNEQGE